MFSADMPMGAVLELQVIEETHCRTGVSLPSLVPTENTEMSNDPELAAYRKVPEESRRRSVGEVPVAVRGVTSVSPPVLEIVYSEILLLPELAAYRYFPEG